MNRGTGPIVACALLVALATTGCAEPPATGLPHETPLARYQGCGWADDPHVYAADCDDPRTNEKYSSPSGVLAERPGGWTCVLAGDSRDEGGPAWSLHRRSPPTEGLPRPATDRSFILGLQYDVSPNPGPVQGVFQVFSDPDAPVHQWTSPEPNGFAIFPEVEEEVELLFSGLVLATPVRPGDIEAQPTAEWNATYAPYARIETTGFEVGEVRQAWGLHSRHGWWHELHPTQVVRTGKELWYFPAAELPVSGSPDDPRDLAGSGHWGWSWDGAFWTDVSDGNASLAIHQAVHLRFDGHREDVYDTSPGCGPCPPLVSDPEGSVRCTLDRAGAPPPSPVR